MMFTKVMGIYIFDQVLEIFYSEKCAVLLNCMLFTTINLKTILQLGLGKNRRLLASIQLLFIFTGLRAAHPWQRGAICHY